MPSLSMYEPMRSINMSMRLLPQNNSPLKTMVGTPNTERFRFIDDAVVLRTRRSADVSFELFCRTADRRDYA